MTCTIIIKLSFLPSLFLPALFSQACPVEQTTRSLCGKAPHITHDAPTRSTPSPRISHAKAQHTPMHRKAITDYTMARVMQYLNRFRLAYYSPEAKIDTARIVLCVYELAMCVAAFVLCNGWPQYRDTSIVLFTAGHTPHTPAQANARVRTH